MLGTGWPKFHEPREDIEIARARCSDGVKEGWATFPKVHMAQWVRQKEIDYDGIRISRWEFATRERRYIEKSNIGQEDQAIRSLLKDEQRINAGIENGRRSYTDERTISVTMRDHP